MVPPFGPLTVTVRSHDAASAGLAVSVAATAPVDKANLSRETVIEEWVENMCFQDMQKALRDD